MKKHFYACPSCYKKELDYMAHDVASDTSVANLLHEGHINRDKLIALEKKVDELIAKYVEPYREISSKIDRFDKIDS